MSLYKQDGSDAYYVSVSVKGRRVRKSTGTSDKKEAQRIHDEIKASLWTEVKTGYTWKKACVAWLKHQPRSEEDRYRLRALTIPNLPIEELSAPLIQKHLPANPATYNRTAQQIMAILNLAKRQGHVDEIPTIERKKVPEGRIRWLTHDEWERLYKELPAHLKPLAKFSICTGMRQHNATHLEWSQVDIRRKVCWIHPDQAKAGKPIGIPLSDDAVAVLRGQIGQHEVWVFPYKRKVRKGQDPDKGRPMEQIKSAWTKALKRAGLGTTTVVGKGKNAKEKFTPNFRWHDLRHTWATWHIQSGLTPLDVLQKLGGWASYSMVLRYAHFAPDYLASYANNAKPYKPMTETMTGTD